MVTSSKQVGSPTKQEVRPTDDKIYKASSSSTLTPWSRLKDPRIVRGSRAFGGKDRHSKVCTIRGLRDRRVRLSVPTAIQLYDLQDRLGFNQPSKVVDWLLEAAKQEIDELPPLPIPPGNFSLNHQAMLSASLGVNILQSNRGGFKMKSNVWDDPAAGSLPQPNFWNSDAFSKAKSIQFIRNLVDEKKNWSRGNGDDKEVINEVDEGQVSSIIALNRGSHSSCQDNSVNHSVPYGSFLHLENPNFQSSHIGSGFSCQTEDLYNLNAMPLSLSSGSSVLLRPPGVTQSHLPSHLAASLEIDPRQISQFQMTAPSTQNLFSNSPAPYPFSIIRPFNSIVTPRPLHSPEGGSQPYKEREFPLR